MIDLPSLGQHKLALAEELLADIELSRTTASAVLLKAARLARLVGDDEISDWLQLELYGYDNSSLGSEYADRTGRWEDPDAGKGYFQGLAELEGMISAYESRLDGLRLPDVSGEWASVALRETRNDQAATARLVSRLTGIRAKVIALLHQFAARTYYELAFSQRQEELFAHARAQVDALLAPLGGDTLAKVDSIYQRLAEGDDEAVSQALTTCRRLIDAVADSVYPPRAEPVQLGNVELQAGSQHHRNRLNLFVASHTGSKSRRDKLRRTLSDLYERVSAGVHADVSRDEARFLFLATYLFLGEVLNMKTESSSDEQQGPS